jgi:hypothetical protein
MPRKDRMTPGVAGIAPAATLPQAAATMRRLPILHREKRRVRMVSLGDLAVRSGNETQVGTTLQQGSEPAAPRRSSGGTPRLRGREGCRGLRCVSRRA